MMGTALRAFAHPARSSSAISRQRRWCRSVVRWRCLSRESPAHSTVCRRVSSIIVTCPAAWQRHPERLLPAWVGADVKSNPADAGFSWPFGVHCTGTPDPRQGPATARCMMLSIAFQLSPRRHLAALARSSIRRSITIASNSAVNPEPGFARGTAICLIPCSAVLRPWHYP